MRAATRKWAHRAMLYIQKSQKSIAFGQEYRSRFVKLDKLDHMVNALYTQHYVQGE